MRRCAVVAEFDGFGAELAAGVYYGNVVSDAKGGSRSDVTVTVTQVGPRKVRIT